MRGKTLGLYMCDYYRYFPSSAPVCALGHLPPRGKALGCFVKHSHGKRSACVTARDFFAEEVSKTDDILWYFEVLITHLCGKRSACVTARDFFVNEATEAADILWYFKVSVARSHGKRSAVTK